MNGCNAQVFIVNVAEFGVPRRHTVVWFPGLTEEGRHSLDAGDFIPLAGSLTE